ncbi:hypothetical protein Syun_025676 [Stephania yunnanensis]|uniref:IREH1/IRE-like N-terminal domain-containing protein n=1 Tax=Stephania yunnanensis TaxID=152371 RepID=A0AAP0ES46_9MAGN
MTDALSSDPHGRLEESIDKPYEKRKNANAEIEEIVKQLAMAGDHDKITAMINLLTNEFPSSPQANHQKVILVLVFVSLIVLVDWIVKFVVLVADWRRTPAIRNQLHIWILVKGTDLISAAVSASKSSFLVDLPERIKTLHERSVKESLLNSASDDPTKFYGGHQCRATVTEKKKKAKDGHGNTGDDRTGFRNACAQEHRTNRKKGSVILLALDNCVSLQSVYMLTIRRPNASGQDCKYSGIHSREAKLKETRKRISRWFTSYLMKDDQAAKDIHPNAKELLGSLHSRFDAAKGVVNDELSHFSRDVKEFLAKEHSSPRGRKKLRIF